MVRILEVIGKRPQGGIGSFITNYQAHFKKDDIKLDYLIFNDEKTGPFDEKVKAMGSSVYVLPELKNTRLFMIWKAIEEFFESYGYMYDAVHLHSVNIAFMVFPAARRSGIENLLSHSHATVYSDNKINAIRNKILCKRLKKQATHYLACSYAAADFLYGKENRSKVLVYNNAIDCSAYKFSALIREKYRKDLNINDSFVVGHVGRFSNQKNHAYLVKVFKCLSQKKDKVKLLLIGDGQLKTDIEKDVMELGIQDKVIFLGARKDISELLMAMDVFVLPSYYEGLPVVGIEAQASGLPCLVSDTVTSEMALTDVRFQSIKDKPEVWADILASMEINDSERRSKAAITVAEKGYDINIEADKLYNFYKKFEKK